VEVRSNGWDTHQNNGERVGELATQVDPGFATLISDLKSRGMLERTLVVWMGEFGRTPKVNANAGRDHFPKVFNAALAGGGVKGGQVIGASTPAGTDVKDHPVNVSDFLVSLCHSLKIDPTKENMSPLGRPIKIVDGGTLVKPLFG
jgi:arylsulfatase A-like enzyme